MVIVIGLLAVVGWQALPEWSRPKGLLSRLQQRDRFRFLAGERVLQLVHQALELRQRAQRTPAGRGHDWMPSLEYDR